MKILKLNDICKIGSSKRIHLSDYVENGVPFYRSKEIIELSEGNPISEPLFISHEKFSEIKHKFPIPKTNDILITSVGTLGVVHLVKDPNFYFKDGNLTWLREFNENIIDIDFLFYWLNSNLFKKQILNNNIGAVQKAITIDFLKKVDISLPEIPNQKSIAAVLSTLDKKIALNKQLHARLEEMAKTLYDYWFVQFDFPDANGKPYKSSGGEMVFDETLKREIPKGWEVKSLKDVLVNRSDNIKSEDLTSNMPYTPIDSLPMRKMTFSDFQKIENARTSLIRYSFNDILIGAMRVYFHRVCIAPFDGITRSTTIVLKPKKQNHLPFLYQLCNEEKTINFASKVSIGTQQPYVNWVNGLAEYKFAMPNLKLIERYSIKIMPLIKSVVTREKQNHQLTQLRDFLLPMLMNGQVSVAE